MLHPLKVCLPVGVSSVGGSVWMDIVMQQCDALDYRSLTVCSSNWFRLSQCNGHCLLLRHSVYGVPEVVLLSPKSVSATFPPDGSGLNSFLTDSVSILYSVVYSLALTGGSTSYLQ